LALVVDDDGGGVLSVSVVAELNFLVAQFDGGFVVSACQSWLANFMLKARRFLLSLTKSEPHERLSATNSVILHGKPGHSGFLSRLLMAMFAKSTCHPPEH
jgi:hypothetical protein